MITPYQAKLKSFLRLRMQGILKMITPQPPLSAVRGHDHSCCLVFFLTSFPSLVPHREGENACALAPPPRPQVLPRNPGRAPRSLAHSRAEAPRAVTATARNPNRIRKPLRAVRADTDCGGKRKVRGSVPTRTARVHETESRLSGF